MIYKVIITYEVIILDLAPGSSIINKELKK